MEDLVVEDVVAAKVEEDLALERGVENPCAAWARDEFAFAVGPLKPSTTRFDPSYCWNELVHRLACHGPWISVGYYHRCG